MGGRFNFENTITMAARWQYLTVLGSGKLGPVNPVKEMNEDTTDRDCVCWGAGELHQTEWSEALN